VVDIDMQSYLRITLKFTSMVGIFQYTLETAKLAGINEKVSMHTLLHSFAMHLLKAHADIRGFLFIHYSQVFNAFATMV
jgi:integrase